MREFARLHGVPYSTWQREHGQTPPYHPGKRKKPGNPTHEARTVPGRRTPMAMRGVRLG